jgi:hypothetical protein
MHREILKIGAIGRNRVAGRAALGDQHLKEGVQMAVHAGPRRR